MLGTVTGKFINGKIETYKALKTADEKDKARTALIRDVRGACALNMESLDEDTLKRYEYEAYKALGLLTEKEFVINIKFGSTSVGEIEFKAYNRAEAEKKADEIGKWIANAYNSSVNTVPDQEPQQ